MAIETLLTILL